MFKDTLLALGLLLTTATQLRIPGSPIGPGELLLVCWLLISIMQGLSLREFVLNRAQRQLLLFWFLFAASLSLGTTVAILTNEAFDPRWFFHDAMAYPLIGMVACLTVGGRDAQAHLDRVAWLLAILGGISLVVLAVGGQGLTRLPVDPWFWERFRGWSQSPNQLAELCTALALVGIHLYDSSNRASRRISAIICTTIAIYIGILTQSDTFRYAMLVSIPIYIVLRLRALFSIPWDFSLIWIAMVGAMIAFAAVLPVTEPSIGAQAGNIVGALSKGGERNASHEVELRKSLWGQALRRGVFDSWLLGLGPGPHLMIPPEIVVAHENSTGEDAPGNTVHPRANGTANFEAHNTMLDLFTQGGLLGAGSFAWVLAMAFWRATASARYGLVALAFGFGVFMMTGNIIRMPTMWFGIALCLVSEPQAAPQLGRPSDRAWRSGTSPGGFVFLS